jgi:hypothetical protein
MAEGTVKPALPLLDVWAEQPYPAHKIWEICWSVKFVWTKLLT